MERGKECYLRESYNILTKKLLEIRLFVLGESVLLWDGGASCGNAVFQGEASGVIHGWDFAKHSLKV